MILASFKDLIDTVNVATRFEGLWIADMFSKFLNDRINLMIRFECLQMTVNLASHFDGL